MWANYGIDYHVTLTMHKIYTTFYKKNPRPDVTL